MTRTTILFGAALSVLALSAANVALAADSERMPYAQKKQGRVFFQDREATQKAAPATPAKASEVPTNPATIEPAAGGDNVQPAEQARTPRRLNDDLRLPRKF